MTLELLSFFVLVAFVVLGALLLYAVYFLSRPHSASDVRNSDALRQFEPRGGRPRFQVRLFEISGLISIWTASSIAFFSIIPSHTLSTRSIFFLASFSLPLVVATWWAWRRGAFRLVASSTPQRPEHPRLEGQESGKRGPVHG